MFRKDIIAKRKRLEDFEIVAMTTESSMLTQHKILAKMKDIGSFPIPCSVGGVYCGQAHFGFKG